MNIDAIRKSLVEQGLIKKNSNAPEEVLRDMYKDHSLTNGSVIITKMYT